MLTAAEISLPTGNLVNGVYDAFGNYYSLPEWVVSDPQNILEDESDKDEPLSRVRDSDKEDGGDDDANGTDEETQRRREEKGKGVVDAREQIKLRARLSETGQDITVTVDKTDSVRTVVRRIASASAVRSSHRASFWLPVPLLPLTCLFSSHHRKKSASPTWARCSKKIPPLKRRAGKTVTLSMPSSLTDSDSYSHRLALRFARLPLARRGPFCG